MPAEASGAAPTPAGRPIDPRVAASVTASWGRIDRWLAENARPLLDKMGKPATAAAISAAEAALGVDLPDDVRASYAVHDGSDAVGLFPSGDYLSLDGMLHQYQVWKRLVGEGAFAGRVSEPRGPIRPVHYDLRWVPLTHNGGGDHTLIDLAPADGGKVGQLIDFSHETGPEGVAADSLAEYLSRLADALEAGAGECVHDEFIDWPSDEPLSRSAFPNPKK